MSNKKNDSLKCYETECGFWEENNICAYGESLVYERPCWNGYANNDDDE